MTEYFCHYQKGAEVGTRQFRTIPVSADTWQEAKRKCTNYMRRDPLAIGYRLIKIDHFPEGGTQLVLDW